MWCRHTGIKSPNIECETVFGRSLEGYTARYINGSICIKANNLSSQSFAVHHINSLLPSGHWPEFLGETRPLFAIRPIWLECDWPSWLLSWDKGSFDALAEQILCLGYNALILGNPEDRLQKISSDLKPYIQRLQHSLRSKQIQLGVVMSGLLDELTLDRGSIHKENDILSCLEQGSLVVVKSRVKTENLDLRAGKSFIESLVEDVRHYEAMGQGKYNLIYYLPFDSTWMHNRSNMLQELSTEISSQTVIAFSAFSGGPSGDYLQMHPFWCELRRMQEPLGLRLLPLVFMTDSKYPSLHFDIFENYYARCIRHNFVGIAAYASCLPPAGDLNHCNLWIAGQLQWKALPPDLYVETWFKSFYPCMEYFDWQPLLKQMRFLVLDIKAISSRAHNTCFQPEELKIIHDMWLSNAKALKIKMGKLQTDYNLEGDNTLLQDVNKCLKIIEAEIK